MLAWSWYALPGLLAFAVGLLVGCFIYFSRPDRAQNRWLGIFIVVAALYLGFDGPIRFLAADEATARGVFALDSILVWGVFGPYLLFLATLDTPLVRWLRPRPVQAILMASTVFAVPAYLLWPRGFIVVIFPEPPYAWGAEWGVMSDVAGYGALAAFLFGFFVALSAWRRAPKGTANRLRASAYMTAFGFRDAAYAGIIILNLVWFQWVTVWLVTPLIEVTYLSILVYGIAKTQLFDIDLKIKWTIRRGTLVGIFVATFFVAAQLIQNYTSSRFGWLGGAVASGLLLFTLQPLQRGIDRMADRAMPNVTPTSDYETFRKFSVYKAAVESAYEEGGVSDKERSILNRMRHKLGVEAEDARLIEAEFAVSAGGGRSTTT